MLDQVLPVRFTRPCGPTTGRFRPGMHHKFIFPRFYVGSHEPLRRPPDATVVGLSLRRRVTARSERMWLRESLPLKGAAHGGLVGSTPRRQHRPLKRDPPLTQLLVERRDIYNYVLFLVGGLNVLDHRATGHLMSLLLRPRSVPTPFVVIGGGQTCLLRETPLTTPLHTASKPPHPTTKTPC